LALLEEAGLLLDEGRTAEVKALVRELPAVFKAEEVHREALAALRLFHEAAEREAATADLARQAREVPADSRGEQRSRSSVDFEGVESLDPERGEVVIGLNDPYQGREITHALMPPIPIESLPAAPWVALQGSSKT
jgi:hypothetical protein